MTAVTDTKFGELHRGYEQRVQALSMPGSRPDLAGKLSGMSIRAGQLAEAAPEAGPASEPLTSPETWNKVATWLLALATAFQGQVPEPLTAEDNTAAWQVLAAARTPVEWAGAWAGILPELTGGNGPGETVAKHITLIAARIQIAGW